MDKRLFIWLAVFFTFSCSPDNKNLENNENPEKGVEYSAFDVGRPAVWESLELARQKERNGGTIEVTRFNGVEQTPEQKIAAEQLYDRTLKNVIEKGWFDFKNAERDGYVIHGGKGTHAVNIKYMLDGEILNPEKPEVLVVINTEEGLMVSGVMFWMDNLDEHGPQIGGHETRWHFHEYRNESEGCVEFSPLYLIYNDFSSTFRKLEWCNGSIALRRTPEMLHIWFMEHDGGRYTSSMHVHHKHILDNPLIRSKGETLNQDETAE